MGKNTILVVAAIVLVLILMRPPRPASSRPDAFAGIFSMVNGLGNLFGPNGLGSPLGNQGSPPPIIVPTSTGNAFAQGSAFGFDPVTGAAGESPFAFPIGPTFQD